MKCWKHGEAEGIVALNGHAFCRACWEEATKSIMPDGGVVYVDKDKNVLLFKPYIPLQVTPTVFAKEPLTVEEDYTIEAKDPGPRTQTPEEYAAGVEYMRKNLFNALKVPTGHFHRNFCTKCNGRGWVDAWPCQRPCTWCKGGGTIDTEVIECPRCHGSGDDGGGPHLRTCTRCAGAGFVKKR